MKIGRTSGAGAKGTLAGATFRIRPGLFMGFCAGNTGKPTQCTCLAGYLGDACALPCPGLDVKAGTVEVCNNKGDCVLDKSGRATCKCKTGFLGRECTLLCPRSAKNNKLCHGRGQCAVNEAFQPTCKCEKGHLGKDCSIPCPGANGDLGACSDHGQCMLSKAGSEAKCKCNEDFRGADCFLACPKDKVGNVCAGHGACSKVGNSDTKCKCQPGWVGKACNKACPKNAAGQVCANQGTCKEVDLVATCKCNGGYLGKGCEAKCPNIVTTKTGSAGCNGHGACKYNADTKTATCTCHVGDGWMGLGCEKECPRATDDAGNDKAVCAGHGKCSLNAKKKPQCKCALPFNGPACSNECPTKIQTAVCTGHGSCNPPKGKGTGKCTCAKGWLGAACDLTCPKGKDGTMCSSHGKCKVAGLRANCICDPQWSAKNCGTRKCGTNAGFFDMKKNECRCPVGSDKCCSRGTAEKAALLDKLVKQERTLGQGKGVFKDEKQRQELMDSMNKIEFTYRDEFSSSGQVFSMEGNQ